MSLISRVAPLHLGLASVFALIALSGCATSHPAYLADASEARVVECHGLLGSWNSCYAEAAAVCAQQDYQVLARNHIDGGSEADVQAAQAGRAYHERSLLVQCAANNGPWILGQATALSVRRS